MRTCHVYCQLKKYFAATAVLLTAIMPFVASLVKIDYYVVNISWASTIRIYSTVYTVCIYTVYLVYLVLR